MLLRRGSRSNAELLLRILGGDGMIVSDLIKELAKIPNQNLPVWTEGGYIHIGEWLHIQVKKSEEVEE